MDLVIDGKRVTEKNAWRFVKARRPHADSHRERSSGWGHGTYVVVRDSTGGASWCYATGKTAGEAWFKVARRMVEHDACVAEEAQALKVVITALDRAETSDQLQAAALRYAAMRVEQSKEVSPGERERLTRRLREIADAVGKTERQG